MLSYSVAVKLLLSVASLTSAQTPGGVFPQVNNDLAVAFNGQSLSPGAVVPISFAQQPPQVGIQMSQTNMNTNQKYIMMMLDMDSPDGRNTRRKRAEVASAASDAAAQPDDPEHSGGRNTFLHCMIQDYLMSGSTNFNGGGAMLLSPGSNGPVGWQPPNPTSGTHRYMFLLFEQPDGFTIPTSMQQMVQGRQNFDLRDFVQQSNLPLPRWGNYFVVGNGNLDGGAATSLMTYTTATTFPNGGPTQSFLAVSTVTGFNGLATPSLTTYTTATTFPNGGPTQTFLTVSTAFVSNANNNGNGNGSGQFGFGTSFATYTSTTTLPNGGPTQTFLAVSTAFGDEQGSSSTPLFTSTFESTTTLPNGGPTETFLTTSTFYSSGTSSFTSGLYYSTGFSGLTTTTSTGPTTFSTTTTLLDGRISSGKTTQSTTITKTITGVSKVRTTTYTTTSMSTTTGIINGQFSTSTGTSSGVVTQTLPALDQSGGIRGRGAEALLEKVVLGLVGMVLAWL